MSASGTDVSLDGLNLPGDEPAAKSKFSLKGKKVQIGLLLLGVMAVEAGVLYIMLPRPSSAGAPAEEHTEEKAEEHHDEHAAAEPHDAHAEEAHAEAPAPAHGDGGHGGGHGGGGHGEAPAYGDNDTVEVPIDSFSCTNTLASPGSVMHLAFDLTATVTGANVERFTTAVGRNHKARIRQTVERVCRSATLEELSDPELSVLKRLIREEVNKLLRQTYIIDIVISDFKLIEQ